MKGSFLAAVRQTFFSFEFPSKAKWKDIDVVLAAAALGGCEIIPIDVELKEDRLFVTALIHSDEYSVSDVFEFASRDLWVDKNVVLGAVSQDPIAFYFFKMKD